MIFLTVGTQFGFDRLVVAVDQCISDGLINCDIFAQIGEGSYVPRHMKFVKFMEKGEYDQTILNSDGLISHAGMGSISMAFSTNKPLLVMPRRACFKEVVNDHQVEIARLFEQEGYLLMAMDEKDIPAKITQLLQFVPKRREAKFQPILDRLNQFLWGSMNGF